MRGHDTGLDYHRAMIDDLTKMDAYARAIQAVVHGGPRPQASRYVVLCLARAGRDNDARLWLRRYRAAFGPHPDVG